MQIWQKPAQSDAETENHQSRALSAKSFGNVLRLSVRAMGVCETIRIKVVMDTTGVTALVCVSQAFFTFQNKVLFVSTLGRRANEKNRKRNDGNEN